MHDILRSLRENFGFLQIAGAAGVILTLHLAGIRSELGSVGFVFSDPKNALIVFTDLTIAFAIAYMAQALISTILTIGLHRFEFAKATLRKTSLQYSGIGTSKLQNVAWTWGLRLAITAAIYAKLSLLLVAGLAFGLVLQSFAGLVFERIGPLAGATPPSVSNETLESYEIAIKRAEISTVVGVICLFSYVLGVSRVQDLKNGSEVKVEYAGVAYCGAPLYYLTNEIVLWQKDGAWALVVPKEGSRIQQHC